MILYDLGLTIAELKNKCRELGIKASKTKKNDLIRVLLEHRRYANYSLLELEDLCHVRNIGTAVLKATDARQELISRLNKDEDLLKDKLEKESKAAEIKLPSKKIKFSIKTIALPPTDFTPGGTPKVDTSTLNFWCGTNIFGSDDNVKWGPLYHHYGEGLKGEEACRAIAALSQMSQINTTLKTFLYPLQQLADDNSRIHCSLNLNTETGRLSSRTPNLQNQPALEKDHYKIRDAFSASEGNTLIVADYGQLELRILAHMTNCQVCIDCSTPKVK